MISSAMSKTSKLHEPIVRVQFVVFEIFTSAYLHQIAPGIMALLVNNSHEKRVHSQVARESPRPKPESCCPEKKKSSRPNKQILKRSEFQTVNRQ